MFDKAHAMELRQSGMTGYDIAREMSVSKSWVYKNLPAGRAHRRWTDDEESKLTAMRARGVRIKHIAARLGRGENEVRIKLCRIRQVTVPGCAKAVGLIAKLVHDYGCTPGRAMQAIRKSDFLARLLQDDS